MKYIMSNGTFKCKENEETVNAISGKLVGIRSVTSESGNESVQLDLAEGEGDETVVRTLSLKKYGDASLKVLRSLYGIAEIIIGKVLTISLEPRDGRSALITVSADGEVLVPCGSVEPYAYDKKLLTDKVLVVLKRCFDFKVTVLVYANQDGSYPTNYDGEFDVEAAAGYIRELRRAGRESEITLKKTTFNSSAAANGYLKALKDLAPVKTFMVIRNDVDIETLIDAFNEELPADEVPEVPMVDENGNEVEY